MESEKINKDSEMADFVADDLIAAWNRRADAHGEWIHHKASGSFREYAECSACRGLNERATKFCPNCAAKMVTL